MLFARKPGEKGFGLCAPKNDLPKGFKPLNNDTYNINSNDYGQFKDKNDIQYFCVPKFYYKLKENEVVVNFFDDYEKAKKLGYVCPRLFEDKNEVFISYPEFSLNDILKEKEEVVVDFFGDYKKAKKLGYISECFDSRKINTVIQILAMVDEKFKKFI